MASDGQGSGWVMQHSGGPPDLFSCRAVSSINTSTTQLEVSDLEWRRGGSEVVMLVFRGREMKASTTTMMMTTMMIMVVVVLYSGGI